MRNRAGAPMMVGVCVVLAGFAVGLYVFIHHNDHRDDTFHVADPSMMPGLQPGDEVTIAPVHGAPPLGAVVLFRSRGRQRISRVVATAGQRVALAGGRLRVDGAPVHAAIAGHVATPDGEHFECVHETTGAETYDVFTASDARPLEEIVVPQGTVWLINDNRVATDDSREHGAIAFGAIAGRVDRTIARARNRIECGPSR